MGQPLILPVFQFQRVSDWHLSRKKAITVVLVINVRLERPSAPTNSETGVDGGQVAFGVQSIVAAVAPLLGPTTLVFSTHDRIIAARDGGPIQCGTKPS